MVVVRVVGGRRHTVGLGTYGSERRTSEEDETIPVSGTKYCVFIIRTTVTFNTDLIGGKGRSTSFVETSPLRTARRQCSE